MSVPSPAELFGGTPSRTSYMVFTVTNGRVSVGAEVRLRRLRAGSFIRQVTLSKPGKHKPLSLNVHDSRVGAPCPFRMCSCVKGTKDAYCRKCGTSLEGVAFGDNQNTYFHPDNGHLPARLLAASLVVSNGYPSLVAQESCNTDKKVLVVFKTGLGRGGVNEYRGEALGWRCTVCEAHDYSPRPRFCPVCQNRVKSINAAFPGEIIVSQNVSRHPNLVSTRMVALLGIGQVFQTVHLSVGGKFHSHYFMWDGKKMLHATMSVRNKTDVF